MKRIFNISSFATLLSLGVIACTQAKPAKIEYHLNDFYGYNETGEKIAVLDTGEETYGPADIPAPEYKVDKYEAPSSIEIEEIESLETVKLEEPKLQEPKIEKKQELRISKLKNPTDAKTINVSAKTHIVEQGETLYALSRKYNIPILPIIIVNKLSTPYNLSIGQKVRIPEARFHIVGDQDTLYSISRYYGVDMNALVKANRLEAPFEIVDGQKLQIPFPTYQPNPRIAAKSTIINENINKASAETPELKKESSKDATSKEVEMHTSTAEVLRPKGLSIMIPPTLKPTEKRAPSYKTALLRKELNKKNSQRKIKYKDDGKFIWPTKGKLSGKFGMQKNNEYNDGIYISAPAGAFVRASLSGKVVYTGDSLKSYGNLVIIKHDNGLLTAYAHMSKVKVKKDDYVKKGDKIGTVGNSGKVKNPQLYFAIRKGKEARDPMMYLR